MAGCELMIRRLPGVLVVKGLVSGVSVNYEDYLRELLNESHYFRMRGESIYRPPESEDAGQCDAVSRAYQIDFKLLASWSELKAIGDLSLRSGVAENGVCYTTECRKPGFSEGVTIIHAAMRGLTVDDLREMRDDRNGEFPGNDIMRVLKSIEKQKHILMLFPYDLYFNGDNNVDDPIGVIEVEVNDCFASLLQYRERNAASYDTFFAVVSGDDFLIFEGERGAFRFLESVSTLRLPSYQYLMKLDDPLFGCGMTVEG